MATPSTAKGPVRSAVGAGLTWAFWLFALNLVWEVTQLPLYVFGPDVAWPGVLYAVLHCTLGDAAIALVAYLIAALVTGETRWPAVRPLAGLAMVLVVGETFTVWAEWYNVYVVRSWGYAGGMPTILGIGVAPLAQWLVLPVVAFAIFRYRDRRPVFSARA